MSKHSVGTPQGSSFPSFGCRTVERASSLRWVLIWALKDSYPGRELKERVKRTKQYIQRPWGKRQWHRDSPQSLLAVISFFQVAWFLVRDRYPCLLFGPVTAFGTFALGGYYSVESHSSARSEAPFRGMAILLLPWATYSHSQCSAHRGNQEMLTPCTDVSPNTSSRLFILSMVLFFKLFLESLKSPWSLCSSYWFISYLCGWLETS